MIESFATGGLDGHQAIIANAAQELNHLAVAIIAALQLAPDCSYGRWQDPVLERGAIAQGPGFARENRHIVRRVLDGLVRECPAFCVSVIWSMLPERSKDNDDFKRTAGRVAEGLQAT
jgi:hypothetical protein